MKKTTISITAVARNFARYVNRVHDEKRSFLLVKNGKPLARLVPESERVCTGADLVKALASVELSRVRATARRKDHLNARKIFKPRSHRRGGCV